MKWTKRLTPIATVAILMVGIAAAPAAADRGYEIQFLAEYNVINPCTEQASTAHYDVTYVVHEHGSDLIFNLVPHKSSAYTSDGYVAVNVKETLVFNQGGVSNPTTALFLHPDGSVVQYRQMINFNANTQELVVFFAGRVCLRP